MLPQYHDARHKVRDKVIGLVKNLAETNRFALDAMKSKDVKALEDARLGLKEMASVTEQIDNDIVVIFAKFTPSARDLREMVSYLKITSALNRIRNNINSYLKNMQGILVENHSDINLLIDDSLRINKCTLDSFDYAIEMLNTFEDDDKIKKLASKIAVEYSKTEDIYSLLEKDMVQKMNDTGASAEEYFNLLKYFRKNLKIIDRLDSIAHRVIFARMGGKL